MVLPTQTMPQEIDPLAAIILAGGNGTRLSALARKITGQETPKQFCPLLGCETLLEQTRRRVATMIRPDRTMTVLTREHEPHYRQLLDASSPNVVIQPCSRGTAPAILYGVLRTLKLGHRGAVAIFPSDHYVSDEERFMLHVKAAARWAVLHPREMVLLGVRPDRPEKQYGWIEPVHPINFDSQSLSEVVPVRCFWEKPDSLLATEFFRRGFLWNTFVVVATTDALLDVFAKAAPHLCAALVELLPLLGTAEESQAVAKVYASLDNCGFSESVLSRFAECLAVLPVSGVSWDDLGEPGRVFQTISRLGSRPAWLDG